MPQGQPSVVPDDRLTTRQRRNRPLLMVHTGDGKGKSTAAFGLALRGWNQGCRSGCSSSSSRPSGASASRPCSSAGRAARPRPARAARSNGTRWAPAGRGAARPAARPTTPQEAAAGWAEIKRRLAAETHDLYVLDEFTYPINWGWVDIDDVVEHSRRPARPSARRDHRPQGRPATDRHRRPGHRDDQRQAPDGRRPEGPAGHRVVATGFPASSSPRRHPGHGKTTVATG